MNVICYSPARDSLARNLISPRELTLKKKKLDLKLGKVE